MASFSAWIFMVLWLGFSISAMAWTHEREPTTPAWRYAGSIFHCLLDIPLFLFCGPLGFILISATTGLPFWIYDLKHHRDLKDISLTTHVISWSISIAINLMAYGIFQALR